MLRDQQLNIQKIDKISEMIAWFFRWKKNETYLLIMYKNDLLIMYNLDSSSEKNRNYEFLDPKDKLCLPVTMA